MGRSIAQTAVLAALVVAAKQALAPIPNIEVVTLLLIAYAMTLGARRTLAISIVFVTSQILIYGLGPWTIMYVGYFPLLSIAAVFDKPFAAVIFGVAMTVLFGLWTTLVEVVFMGGLGSPHFWAYIYYRYISGIYFFAAHIICNAVVLPLCLSPLTKMLKNFIGQN